jgi:hypothetical protein
MKRIAVRIEGLPVDRSLDLPPKQLNWFAWQFAYPFERLRLVWEMPACRKGT